MLFKKPLYEKIISGEKVATRRPLAPKMGRAVYSTGQRVGIRYSMYKKTSAFVTIKRRFTQKLGEVTEDDAKKEGLGSLEEFKRIWILIYQKWDPEELVYVYEWDPSSVTLTSLDSANKDKPAPQATL